MSGLIFSCLDELFSFSSIFLTIKRLVKLKTEKLKTAPVQNLRLFSQTTTTTTITITTTITTTTKTTTEDFCGFNKGDYKATQEIVSIMTLSINQFLPFRKLKKRSEEKVFEKYNDIHNPARPPSLCPKENNQK